MKKIVFISVSQPSINPRLVKEANALADAGFDVQVIYSFWTKWALENDKFIIANARWTAVLAGGSPFENRARYFFTRVREKVFGFIAKRITLKFGIAEIARGRTYPEMLKKAKAIKADLYIAHIQAAMPVAVKAAKKYSAKCGFDVEDFHRQEVNDDTGSYNYKISEYLEDKYYPQLDYITTSSPQISEAYRQLYPDMQPVTIPNVFPKSTFLNQRLPNSAGPLKLFWFSQTVGSNRGLINIAKALKSLKESDFELHILGYIKNDEKSIFIKTELLDISNVYFHSPMPPGDIVGFAAQFDIGFAGENNKPLNRDICLTNKIFTYIEAGLAIIVSDTIAQKCFITDNPDVGEVYDKEDVSSLITVLSTYNADRKMLFDTCEAALKLGREKLNWENERIKFLSLVNETLDKS